MANIKISELEQISTVENDDILPIVDSSSTETKKIKISDLISNEYGINQTKGYSQEYINNLHTYSTNEIRIGTWIDGKPVYRKVINFGNLPNATTKDVAHGISNLKDIIKIEGVAVGGQYRNPIPLVYYSADAQYNTAIYVGDTYVSMQTSQNRSSMTAYVYLEYTKTTD